MTSTHLPPLHALDPSLRAPATTLHALVVASAARHPGAVAVVDGLREVTYAELARHSAAVAARLREAGARPGSLVGLCLDRGADLLVGMLGILRTGAAYVPLDPTYPAERTAFIRADAGLRLVVTDESNRTGSATEGLDAVVVAECTAASTDTDAPGHPGSLAYLIYTSGSTGRPKAVAITHGNATSMLEWAARRWDAEDLAGVLAATSVCFDLSVYEIFLPLTRGGTVIVAADALALPGLPARDRVRLVNTVPSAMNQLVRAGDLPAGVRTVNLAGEALTRALADRVLARSHVQRLWNLYGPSEDTTYSTAFLVPAGESEEPAIGRPIDGTEVRILDGDLQPVAEGDVGELFLSGNGVARGYLGRPGLTADRFLPDPWSARPGARMYRTGDLVRRHRGQLMFLGRSDSQVKVRGHRIETGEIDAVLGRHPDVGDAVTVCDRDAAGEARLVTYVETGVAADDTGSAALRQWLGERLPAYAVPASLMLLPRLPRTPNGKVDRAALPEPRVDRGQAGVRYVAPVTALETTLTDLWAELLGVDRVGLADRFDDLGGHSLLATVLLGQVEDRLDTAVPLGAFLAAPTPAGLAAAVSARLGVRTGVPLVAGVGRDPGPLSPVQEDFWFSEQLPGPECAMYTVPVRLRVRATHPGAPVDAAALGRALTAVVSRHEALRTAFTETAGQIAAVVVAPYAVTVTEDDLRGVPADARPAALEDAVGRIARAPIDAARGHLLRAHLVRLAPAVDTAAAEDAVAEAELVVAVHHLGFDGWSSGVLLAELGAELSGATVEAPAVQAADYTAWRMGTPAERRADGLAFWRAELSGADLDLVLPTDRPHPPVLTFRGRRTTRPLDPTLIDGLRDLGRRHRGSLFTTLLAGLDVLLHQVTGRTDVVVGCPVADRSAVALRRHIGLCINTLPMRAVIDPEESFGALLTQCTDRVHAAMAWPDVSYVDVIRDLALPRSTGRTNLVQVMLAVQNYAVDAVTTPDLVLEHLPEPDNGTSKVDLTLFVEFTSAGPTLAAEWSTGVFDEGTIQAWLDQYLAVLADAVDRPGRTVAELGSAATLRRVRPVAEGPAVPTVGTDSLHALVLATAARHPHRVAVTDGGTTLTYAELVAAAEELATRLRTRGAGPGSLVAVCLDRHPRMLTALLAVLMTGGAYLPVDPDFPADRVAFLLADSGAALLLTEHALLTELPEDPPPLLLIDDTDNHTDGDADPAPAGAFPRVDAAELAYILYTSGSTGRPKGVEITHASMTNFLAAMANSPGLTAEDRVAALTTLSFDIAGLELWLPLVVGACVVVMDRATASDGALLGKRIEEEGVTVLQATPMTWRLLLAGGWDGKADLRAWCGGEALPADLAGLLRPRVAELWNLYGPTEATIWTSTQRVDDVTEPVVPIGRPIAGTTAWVLDARMRPVVWGAVGELCLGGAGVARGYRDRPDLTASRFVPDPFGPPGARLYRTGDRARLRADGSLEFLGRDDDQVKVRGYRIELGEIESVLRALPGVSGAAAAVWGDDPADQRLVAYVVADDGAELDPDALRTAAQGFLPDHMVPSQLDVLAELPLTPNRKLDRAKLPAPGRAAAQVLVAPRDAVEQIVAEVWCEVLGIGEVSVLSNFFALGGHSLLATRIVGRLGQRFDLAVPVRLVFEAPTVERQARRLEESLLAALLAEDDSPAGSTAG